MYFSLDSFPALNRNADIYSLTDKKCIHYFVHNRLLNKMSSQLSGPLPKNVRTKYGLFNHR